MNLDKDSTSCFERLCKTSDDWIRYAPTVGGLERFEAFFRGHAYDPHRHDFYAVGLTLQGRQTFNYRGEVVTSLRGNTIVVHPDERHDGRSGGNEGFTYRMVYVDPSKLLAAMPEGQKYLPFSPVLSTDDRKLFSALIGILDDLSSPVDELMECQFLAELADAMLSRRGTLPKASVSGDSQVIARIKELLRSECGLNVRVGQLESESGMDRFSLSRHFRKATGTSPHRYLVMRRLERARQLIGAGNSLVASAAESGFADQAHMTRAFKKAYGVTPGTWRQLFMGNK